MWLYAEGVPHNLTTCPTCTIHDGCQCAHNHNLPLHVNACYVHIITIYNYKYIYLRKNIYTYIRIDIDTSISTCVRDTGRECETTTFTHCLCRYMSTMFVVIVWSMSHVAIRTMSVTAAVIWQLVGWEVPYKPSSSCLPA